ncbi:MAG: HEAT repeat domain-containing protein [Bacteroidaceae bacterium]|nr:HEAT repeat domain-containing protein [Bacteroidaceae bacterium]
MKKTILSLFMLCLAISSFAGAKRDGFAIVIDPTSLSQAKAEVEAYAAAIEQAHGLKVYTIVDRWGIPDSIRAELIRLHAQKEEPVIGAVFVGDIPVPMIRDAQHMTSAFKMDQSQPRKKSSVPSDRFYDDFNLKFRFLERDSDANYFYYSLAADGAQRTYPTIYSGRIRPSDVNGVNRYEKLRAFLRKAVAMKQQPRQLQKMFFFSGHGYISDSKVARMDEKVAWFEHFPQLNDKRSRISYMDHSDHNPVKEHFMCELMRGDLDFAHLHHHGAPEMEYFNGAKQLTTVKQAKEFILKNVRQHIMEAKQRGRDWEKTKATLKERFDLPDSWLENVLDEQLAIQDSLEDAADDLYLEDFAVYGYQPNSPVVIIDACYCGSFHLDDCIADEYIFQPGTTVAVVANTVNSLQDKWSDCMMGLIAEGGCIGDMPRFSTYLESHVIGDPTFRYEPADGKGLDIDHLINENKPATWRKLLKSPKADLQCLAIWQLCRLGLMTSSELRKIYESSRLDLVRLMALVKIADFRDDNAIEVIKAASQDAFEMAQRFSLKYIHDSGDERLIPALIAVSIENNTSDRVNFDARAAIGVYPKDKLLAEFAKQFDSPEVKTLKKDTIRALIARTIEVYAGRGAQEIEELDTAQNAKEIKFAIRSQRNNLVHAYVPFFLDYINRPTTTVEQQVMILEALGWHPRSYQAPLIADRCMAIYKDERYDPQVRNEALKTYNRVNAK